MMINKRLIETVSESKRYIAGNVLMQWISLLGNLVMMTTIANLLEGLYQGNANRQTLVGVVSILAAVLAVRYLCAIASSKMSYLSSKAVKRTLREQIYQKMLRLGAGYHQRVQTSEVVQVAVEGVEQLETYFGAYLPQFFYAMLAPLTLFIYLSFVNLPSAAALLICVPLIPVAIAAVQTWAKKLLARYWGQYTEMGDTFLENLQGLTTLKIYQADGFKQEEMNRQAEQFRKITMKVLTMQLNSITIMDLIAYGGAALGVVLSVTQLRAGKVDLSGCLLIILLSADFFIPMRQLGSFFHIAMNGMAASDKIFHLLDLPESEQGRLQCPKHPSIRCEHLGFGYEKDRAVLEDVNMDFQEGSFTAIVGKSGCGKSTVSSILMGHNKGYTGSVTVNGIQLNEIAEDSLMENFTYISHQSYLFKGSVRDNLLAASPQATDRRLWEVLEQVKLSGFLKEQQGLDTQLTERASNLSGGQCQRLCLARALLHDSPVYIFDEATSNIDVESENEIMEQIHRLAEQKKTVILISHRLANVCKTDRIYVMQDKTVVESGTHEELLHRQGVYSQLWSAQQELEQFAGGKAE